MTGKPMQINYDIEKLGIYGWPANYYDNDDIIIPPSFFKHVCRPSGKSDLLAIMILGVLIWWYQTYQTDYHDKDNCDKNGRAKKFSGDMLGRAYAYYAKYLGVSKLQVKQAIDRLVKAGYVKREFRTELTTFDELDCPVMVSNALYLAPIAETIKTILGK